jgi:hypothetical protein
MKAILWIQSGLTKYRIPTGTPMRNGFEPIHLRFGQGSRIWKQISGLTQTMNWKADGLEWTESPGQTWVQDESEHKEERDLNRLIALAEDWPDEPDLNRLIWPYRWVNDPQIRYLRTVKDTAAWQLSFHLSHSVIDLARGIIDNSIGRMCDA